MESIVLIIRSTPILVAYFWLRLNICKGEIVTRKGTHYNCYNKLSILVILLSICLFMDLQGTITI